MEHIYLLGSEQVQTASSQIRSSAEQISRALANFEASLQQHQQWMDNWLLRFEAAMSHQTGDDK